MASTNQSPFYKKAEAEFFMAQSDEERVEALKVMMKECPKHKSSEKMLANLKTRLIKLEKSVEKKRKSRKSSGKQGIKKADMQAIIVGMPNTGKSSLFNVLTNLNAKTSPHAFSTYEPQLGTMDYEDIKVQTIDMPPFPTPDIGLINTTDAIILVIDKIEQIQPSMQFLQRAKAKKIIVFNKIDTLTENDKRKISENLKSKKLDFIMFSCNSIDDNALKELKMKIFESFPIIRIYTKEPRKSPTITPMILKKGSTISTVAEKIMKGFSKKIKSARIWGPSSKFFGQVVGLEHVLRDKDLIELQEK